MAILEAVIEVIILVLPIRELHQLKLSRKRKVAVSSIFALGGFVVITGIVRMAVLYRPKQHALDLTKGDIWFNVHLGTAIISACLPTFRPLLRLFRPKKQPSYPLNDLAVKKQQRAAASASPDFTESMCASNANNQQTNAEKAAWHSDGSINMVDLQMPDEAHVDSGAANRMKQSVDIV